MPKSENQNCSWYQNNYFIAFCFISVAFIPLGIFLIWKFKNWETWLKTLFTGLFTILFVTSPFIISNMIKSFYGSKKENPILTVLDTSEKGNTKNDLNIKDKAKNKKEKSNKKSESQKSKSENSEKKDNSKEKVVYITKSGKKYHSKDSCGRGKFIEISLDEAVRKGYSPCKKCFK